MANESASSDEQSGGDGVVLVVAVAEHSAVLNPLHDAERTSCHAEDSDTANDSNTHRFVEPSDHEKPRRASESNGGVALIVAEDVYGDAHADSDVLVASYVPWKCAVYAFVILLGIAVFYHIFRVHHIMFYGEDISCAHSLIYNYRRKIKKGLDVTALDVRSAFLEWAIQCSFAVTATAAWTLPLFVRPRRSLMAAGIAIAALHILLVVILNAARLAIIHDTCLDGFYLFLIASAIMAPPLTAVLFQTTRFAQLVLPVCFHAPARTEASAEAAV